MSELSLTGSLSISDQLILSASLLDTDGNTGTMGQVFSSTVTGSKWVDADSGAQGAQGTQGVQGEIGTQGTQGIQGETGTTGTQGTQGTQGETGTQGENGTQGETGTDGTFGGASFDYTFDSGTTAADPGTGEVALSSTTQNTATEMYIDATDDNGSSINTFMTSIDAVTSAVKGHVRVSSKTDANTFLLFAISDLTNNTGWWTIDISIEASSASAPFSNSDDVVVSFVTTGDRGDKGDTGTQGTSGDTGAQGTSGATPFPYIGDAQITGSLLVQGDVQVEGNDAFVYQGKGATTGYQGIKLENSAGNFQAGVATNIGVFFSDSTANSANIGTTQEKNLHLAVNDLTKIFVSSSGNVGIGPSNTTGVDNKLSIEGSGLADENVLKINNQVNASTRIWLRNSAQSAYIFNSGATPDTLATGLLSQAVGMGIANDSPVQFFTGLTPTVKLTVSTTGVEITGSFQSTGSAEFSYLSGSAGAAAWSTGGALNNGRKNLGGAGTQDAGSAFGGYEGGQLANTEEYNGTAWSNGGALQVARYNIAGAGIQNATLAFGGNTPGIVACTEEYSGTAWSTGGALQVARSALAGAGTQNAGLAFGGRTNAKVECTEEYNGTAWSTGGALAVSRYELAGAGTQDAGLAFGGNITTGDVACTEEYNGTAWSTGGALQVARNYLAGAGTQNAGLAFGGAPGGSTTSSCTEEYNGTAWSTGAALGSNVAANAGAGTQTAALSFGGTIGPVVTTGTQEYSLPITYTPKKTFEYDDTTGGVDISGSSHVTGSFVTTGSVDMAYQSGSATFTPGGSWSTGGALQVGRRAPGGAGTQTAGLVFGGTDASSNYTSCTEEYDGSSWSTGGALGTALYSNSGIGTQNAALSAGGGNGSLTACTFEYDGSSWSAGGDLQVARYNMAGGGTQDAAIVAGGGFYNQCCICTEEYNGTSWSNGGSLSQARYELAGAGTQNATLASGGVTNTQTNCTEEYDGTSWSTATGFSTTRRSIGGNGTQNAALIFGGNANSNNSCTEEYNGSTWSTSGALQVGRCCSAGAGLQSAALAIGGRTSAIAGMSCTEEYNQSTVSTFTTVKSFEYDETNGIVILSQVADSSQDYEDDTAAAAGGVPVGGLYRNGNVVSIRIS